MKTTQRWLIFVIVMGLLAASLGCLGSTEDAETPPPTATEAATSGAETEEAPPISGAQPLGDAHRNEEGGFAFRAVPDYEVEHDGDTSILLATDADARGPGLVLMGGEFWEGVTPAELLEIFMEEAEIETGAATAITIGGVTGLSADQSGDGIAGRIVALMPTGTQGFLMMGRAPLERWDELEPLFETVLASVEFFAPVAPATAPGSGLVSGWYAYVNSNVVRDVLAHEGRIYAATLGGLVVRQPESGYGRHYTPLDGMGHVSSHALAACEIYGEERIVVGTLHGLSLFDPQTGMWDGGSITPEESQVTANKVTRLYCDRDQRWLLIGYRGLGVLDIDGGEFARFTTDEGLSWNGVSDIAVRGAEIWVASGYNGLTQIVGDQVTVYDAAAGMPDERAHALAFAPDGTLWVGGSQGLMKYSGGEWTLYEEVKEINEIEIAADGSVWVATAPLGAGRLCRFDPQAGSCVADYRDTEGQAMLSLALDPQGRAIYGTNRGLYIFDESTGSATPYVNQNDQLATNFVDAIATAPDGSLWIGTDGGLQLLDPAAPDQPWTTYRKSETPGLGGSWGTDFAFAPDGTVWVAIINGDASRFQNGAWTSFEGLRSYKSVAVDAEGRAWFGSDREGIVVLNADGSRALTLTTAEGLPSDRVQALLADGEIIWIALDVGLARYAGGDVELLLDKDRLPHPYLRALALDPAGALIIGANLSLARYDGNTAEVLFNFQQEGYRDWLTTLSVAPDGRIWAGTQDGLFYFEDEDTWGWMTTSYGLLTDFISALHVDPYGAVWVGGGGSNYDGGGLLHMVP